MRYECTESVKLKIKGLKRVTRTANGTQEELIEELEAEGSAREVLDVLRIVLIGGDHHAKFTQSKLLYPYVFNTSKR